MGCKQVNAGTLMTSFDLLSHKHGVNSSKQTNQPEHKSDDRVGNAKTCVCVCMGCGRCVGCGSGCVLCLWEGCVGVYEWVSVWVLPMRET